MRRRSSTRSPSDGAVSADRTAADGHAALDVTDLTVGYGRADVLHGVSLRVAAGGLAAVVGANGAGKTTLLRTIMGFLSPSGGSVTMATPDGDARALTGLSAHDVARSGVALVPEGRQILASMSVEENLELGGYALRRSDVEQLKPEMYDRFPVLGDRRRQQAGYLSGGEQQMLAIARALMSRPRLMLLDEPSLGLAPLIVQEVFEIIREVREQGTSVLLVEQNTHAALSMSDEGFVIASGRVVLSGPGPELLLSDEIQDAYLGGNPG